MRLSVECAFPHLRKRRPTSRKSALWPRRLTQRRILRACRHQRTRSVSPRRLPKTDVTLAWRGERPSSCGGATDPLPLPSPPSIPFPVSRKHQVLRLGLGCIKRTFPFGERWETRPPVNLPCSTLRHAVAKRARGAAAWGRKEARATGRCLCHGPRTCAVIL